MTKDCCPKEHDNTETLFAETVETDIIISNTITAEDIVTNTLRANGYVSLPDGSAAQPALRFNTWPNSGIYYAGRTMTIVIGQAPVIQMGFDSGQIFHFLRTVIPVGNAGTPSLTFSGDADTGLYRQNANQIGLTTGGINRLSLSATGMQYSVNSYAPTGMTGSPSMSFSNDTTSGLYYDTSENSIGVSHSSQKKMTVSPTGTNFYDNNVLTGSVLSNGFNSSLHEVLFVDGTSQTYSTGVETTFTNYSAPTLNRGFATISSGVITIPSDGLYHIVVFATYGANVNGYRNLRITNSSGTMTTNRTLQATNDDAGAGCRLCHTVHYNASSGDTLTVLLQQTSGISLGCFVSGLSIVRLF